ncbi:hypothetical protein CYY_003554 [Polysphondylium violaceum]|uniref:Pre-mRNA-splicing factor CWC15 n=1 Tax=Polysphondylium violaceum TaxID=133409 RepID=A0A8J4V8K8_9MYCE|nr:hypothetical protein CYY_003554 [Polysphondylium violaceum]
MSHRVPSRQYSSKAVAAHTVLKSRADLDDSGLKQDKLLDQLREKENKSQEVKRKQQGLEYSIETDKDLLRLKNELIEEEKLKSSNTTTTTTTTTTSTAAKKKNIDADDTDSSDDDDDSSDSSDEEKKKHKKHIDSEQYQDNSDNNSNDSDDSDDSDDSSDEDDEEELMRELENIKREKAEQQKRKEMEKEQEQERIRLERAANGNPLFNEDDGYSTKKKWFDDGVFKNQARDEPVTKKRFINDTTRNDFAKKFLGKYIK